MIINESDRLDLNYIDMPIKSELEDFELYKKYLIDVINDDT